MTVNEEGEARGLANPRDHALIAGNAQGCQALTERFVAKRMGATTVELRSSHVPMLSQPHAVLDVIRNAAKAVQKSQAA